MNLDRVPKSVRKAQQTDDGEALKRLGSLGGQEAARRTRIKKEEEAAWDEAFLIDHEIDADSVARERGDHLIPEHDR